MYNSKWFECFHHYNCPLPSGLYINMLASIWLIRSNGNLPGGVTIWVWFCTSMMMLFRCLSLSYVTVLCDSEEPWGCLCSFTDAKPYVHNVPGSKPAAGTTCVFHAVSAKLNWLQTTLEKRENLVLFRDNNRLYVKLKELKSEQPHGSHDTLSHS